MNGRSKQVQLNFDMGRNAKEEVEGGGVGEVHTDVLQLLLVDVETAVCLFYI